MNTLLLPAFDIPAPVPINTLLLPAFDIPAPAPRITFPRVTGIPPEPIAAPYPTTVFDCPCPNVPAPAPTYTLKSVLHRFSPASAPTITLFVNVPRTFVLPTARTPTIVELTLHVYVPCSD